MSVINLNKSNATNYQLIFPLLPVEKFYEKSKDFTLNIFGTILPSISLEPEQIPWQGAKIFSDTGELTYGTWSFDFTVDSEFKNWLVLYHWIMAINNDEDNFGFVKEKKKVIDATLLIMNNYRKPSLKIRFHDIWPSEIGDVSMSKRDTDDDLMCNATFIYDKYVIDNQIL